MNFLLNSNEANVFASFLQQLKVKHTRAFSNKFYNEHPHKYNLFGLSKMLAAYGVDSKALQLNNREEIHLLEAPFIAHITNDFVTVYRLNPKKIYYIWKGRDITISIEEFNKIWSGVILVAEPNKNSGEQNYKENRFKESFGFIQQYLLLISICLLIILMFISKSIFNSIGLSLSLFINLVGIYIGYLLVLKQVHIHSSYADKICSLFKKSDCNNILESPASKFLGLIGWSEIGLGYFISNTVIILFLPHLISYLSIINICILPYSFWSVWYQKYKAEEWCSLCLIVQLLLWSVFAANYIYGVVQLPIFSIEELLLISCVYLIPTILINTSLSMLIKGHKTEQITQEINSLKMNDEVFLALLKLEHHYVVNKTTSKIIFGNPDSTILITILTNPHCQPCAQMHKRVENVLHNIGDKICVQYIFSSFNEELDSSNKFLISIYLNKNVNDTMEIYNEWFTKGKYQKESFFKKHNFNLDEEHVCNEFQNHNEWKMLTKLRATPTILYNGYILPDSYKIEDLEYFTDLYLKI